MTDHLFEGLDWFGAEVPDINFFIQIAGDHLEEAQENRKIGKRREMYWQLRCLSDALSFAIILLKREGPTLEADILFRRIQELKDGARALLGI